MQGSDIADLVAATLDVPEKNKLVDLVSALQHYPGYKILLGDGGVRVKMDDGVYLSWDVLVQAGNNARFVGIGEKDVADVLDGIAKAQVPWSHFTSNWSYDEKEIAMQGTEKKVVDLILTRRAMDTVDVAAKLEDAFWGRPASATDVKTPLGLQYWIVVNATKGFNGGAPYGSTVAGINCTTYDTWRNWTAQYTAVTKADFCKLIREGMVKTKFQSPITLPSAPASGQKMWGMYCGYALLSALEDLLEAQNDNLGNDIAPKDGMVMFRRNQVDYIPQLDALDAGTPKMPFYGINWSAFQVVGLRGEFWKETKPLRSGTQHSSWTAHRDLSFQIKCLNRRTNLVLYSA